jgi:hypothetical protein
MVIRAIKTQAGEQQDSYTVDFNVDELSSTENDQQIER